jgi:hypothetical protein
MTTPVTCTNISIPPCTKGALQINPVHGGTGLPARPSVQDGGGTVAAQVKFGDPLTLNYTGSHKYWAYDSAHPCSINVDAPADSPSTVMILLDASSPTAWCGNYGGIVTIGSLVHVIMLHSDQAASISTNNPLWWCGSQFVHECSDSKCTSSKIGVYDGCDWAALSANDSTASFQNGATISSSGDTVFMLSGATAINVGTPLTYGMAITLQDAGGAFVTYDTYGVGDLGSDTDPAEAMSLTVCNAQGASVITVSPQTPPTPPPTQCTQTCTTWKNQQCGGSPGSWSCPAGSVLNCSQNNGCTCICEAPTSYNCTNVTGPSDPKFPVTNPANCAEGTAECTQGVGCTNGLAPVCGGAANNYKWTCGSPAATQMSPVTVSLLVVGACVVLTLVVAAIFAFIRASIRTSRATR